MLCLVVVMSIRELVTQNKKTFQDIAGLSIVYSLSIAGPVLCQLAPKVNMLHWIPIILAGSLQFLFIAMGKPVDEWWLIATIAPFTVGTPLLAMIAYKAWFAPRFGLSTVPAQSQSL